MAAALLLALLQSPSMDWENLLWGLRGPALEDPLTAEGQAFLRVKALGPAALPHLTRFISHSDIDTVRAAVRTLQALTGRACARPTYANQLQIKAEWEAWIAENAARVASVEDDPHLYLVCALDDAAAREAVAGLSADDPARRAEAKAALLHAGLIHQDLLQASLDTRDADVRDAVREILARAEGRRPHLRTLAGSGDWVREQCLRIAREHPQPEPFRARLTGFLAALDLLRCTPEGVLRRSKDLARLHALDDPERAHWRAAAQAWTRTLAEPALPLEAKQAVHHALEDVEEGSVAHADVVRRQALREVEAGRRTEGLRLLEAARPRFDGTAGGAFLETVREALAP